MMPKANSVMDRDSPKKRYILYGYGTAHNVDAGGAAGERRDADLRDEAPHACAKLGIEAWRMTTDTPLEQLFSIASRAVTPPKLAP